LLNARRATWPTVAGLVVFALAAVALRASYRQGAWALPGDSFWRLTYTLNFKATKAKAGLDVAFPGDTARSRVFDRKVDAAGVSVEQRRRRDEESRQFELLALTPGKHQATIHFDLHLSTRAAWRSSDAPVPRTAESRAEYLAKKKGLEVDDPVVAETLAKLQTGPAGKLELVERIFEYCVSELRTTHDAPSDAAAALKQRTASSLGRVRAMVVLCRAAKIPARLVTGFVIRQDADVRPHVWAEVLTNGHWEPYDPDNGFTRELPHNFVPVRRDGVAIVRTRDTADLDTKFSIVRMPPPPGALRSETRHLSDIFDLQRVPLEMHEVFEVILLMPLGALVTAIFRTLIGINTFGTFTPTLLALSFVYNDWRTGIVVFVTVIVLGMVTRALLDRLKLLLVPRLSVILTLVALTIVFAVSALFYLSWAPTDAVLLPMVILTMTVERFYLTSEEDSPRIAAQLLANTVLVAVCCYLVLRWQAVGRMLLVYPELHLVTIAVLILLGRYSGYRLSELMRFRDLVRQPGDAR
jgi:transglutaminase-like putative cysteine protease